MSAFILLSGSEEKHGQVYPEVLEFKNDAALKAWLADGGDELLNRWSELEGETFGGWPTAHILIKGSGDDPTEWGDYLRDDE